jgi:hypothetical protein
MTHLFDPATDPITGTDQVETQVVLVPCSADYGRERAVTVDAVYTVTNEFGEHHESTAPKMVSGQLVTRLSDLDPQLFTVGMQGTLSGQTRFSSANGQAFVALAVETHRRAGTNGMIEQSAIRAVHGQGETAASARIDLFPACVGDCNANDDVGLDELVSCLNVANGNRQRVVCPACDMNRDGSVSMGELMVSLQNSAGQCVEP